MGRPGISPGMKAFYCDHFELPLPLQHRFPMVKYRRLRERLQSHPGLELLVPVAASDEQLLRVHSRGYLERLKTGTLERQEIRRIGFPYSPELVERSRRSTGATIEACRQALQEGVAANLAGGTHHAFRDRGEGFCVFNDSVVALKALQAEGRIEQGLVLDCDVHQGNGTASLVVRDESLFSFSIHGANNFPFRKERSDLDIALEDGTEDAEYLRALDRGLERVLSQFQPDLVIYLSGADPYVGDKLGRLSLTKAGLRRRDELVFDRLGRFPIAVTMGGGYAHDPDDIVDIHAQTVSIAAAFGGRRAVS